MQIAKKKNENRWIHVKERGANHILFYSICAVVPVFITGVRIKENECAFHSPLLAEKGPLLNVVLYKIGNKSSP